MGNGGPAERALKLPLLNNATNAVRFLLLQLGEPGTLPNLLLIKGLWLISSSIKRSDLLCYLWDWSSAPVSPTGTHPSAGRGVRLPHQRSTLSQPRGKGAGTQAPVQADGGGNWDTLTVVAPTNLLAILWLGTSTPGIHYTDRYMVFITVDGKVLTTHRQT